MICPDCGQLDMVYLDCKICNGPEDAKRIACLPPSASQLSPASRAAYEALCRGVLEVALAGENVHPGDVFLKESPFKHFDHAYRHLSQASTTNYCPTTDSETGLVHWAHAAWRIALMAAVQRLGK